jgi:CheY-like chemotaxis protein
MQTETIRACAAPAPPHRGNGERVLVVDDEPFLADMYRRTLLALGYDAESTSQPADAIAIIESNPQHFSLVLLDQAMPGISGMTVAGQLLRICPDLAILLMTGFAEGLTADRVKAAGLRDLLTKPISRRAMGTALHLALLPKLWLRSL